MILTTEARPSLEALSPVPTTPTFPRFVILFGSAIPWTGRRTVADLLRTAAPLADGHRTTSQRVRPSAARAAPRLARRLRRVVPALVPGDRPVTPVGDDTVDGHPGRGADGEARHRDPVRSGHGYTAWRSGHEWAVLAALIRFPRANRPRAWPVLVDPDRSEDGDRQRRRPHRTPARVMTTLRRVMILRVPDRRPISVADPGSGTHETARFVHRHRARPSPVSELHPEANRFEPPPPDKGKGRPPVKGPRRPEPREAAATAGLRTETVAWYGGGERGVGVTTGTGHRDKSGSGPVPLIWVFVKGRAGTHRDGYFLSTDPSMTAAAMVGAYAGRWDPETTFQEVRGHLGMETTRGRCRGTIPRAAPRLFGLDAVVALLHRSWPESKRSGRVEWPGKRGVTDSDALTSVRRRLWRDRAFPQAGGGMAVDQRPESLHKVLFYALAPAA